MDLFGIKKRIKAYKEEKQKKLDYRILTNKEQFRYTYQHISYDVNPFLYYNTTPNDIKYIEDIKIEYIGYFPKTHTVDYIVRYPYLSIKKRKEIVNEIIKKWEIDYYSYIDQKLKKIFEKASYIPVKNVRLIKNREVNTYILLALIFLILLKQYSFLQLIPYIGNIFARINRLLIFPRYYNIMSIIVYLSIIISMYLIIVKVYFDKVLKFGLSAKGFLIKERDRMLKKFKPNIHKMRKHLYRLARKVKVEKKYEITHLYDTKAMMNRIERYGNNIINRVGIFTSYYKSIFLVSRILRLIVLGLIIYLIISLFINTDLTIWK
ncbi:MAG TPA: hypothetical protein VIK84_03580 [Haloplasmataceae bacterium]